MKNTREIELAKQELINFYLSIKIRKQEDVNLLKLITKTIF